MEKSGKKKRSVFRIEVTASTVTVLEKITAEIGITQIALASKLVNWLSNQPALVQQAILGLYPDDIEQDVGELILRRMQQEPTIVARSRLN